MSNNHSLCTLYCTVSIQYMYVSRINNDSRRVGELDLRRAAQHILLHQVRPEPVTSEYRSPFVLRYITSLFFIRSSGTPHRSLTLVDGYKEGEILATKNENITLF